MRVIVDLSTCRGYASCMLEAPAVFDLDDDENVVRVLMEDPPDAMRPDVERAVRLCPTRSIAIADTE